MKRIRSIAELRTDWINLHDLDRAKAVRDLHNAGVSIRQVAAHLQKPESSLRRLLTALDAPVEDRALARKGLIKDSTADRAENGRLHHRLLGLLYPLLHAGLSRRTANSSFRS